MSNKTKQFKRIPSLERNQTPLTGNTGTNNKAVKKVARFLVVGLTILTIVIIVIIASILF